MLFEDIPPKGIITLCLCHVFIAYRWLVIFFFAVSVSRISLGFQREPTGITLRKLHALCFDKYVIECPRMLFHIN